jgi:hypothetical protein
MRIRLLGFVLALILGGHHVQAHLTAADVQRVINQAVTRAVKFRLTA